MNQELLDNINYYEDSHLVKMFENLNGFERLSLVSELWCLPEETNLSYSLSQINRDKLGELLGYYFDRDTRSELLSLLFESQFPMVTMMVVDDTLQTETYEEGKIRTHITTQNNHVLEYNIEKRRSGKYKPVADLKLNVGGYLSLLRMYKPQGGYVDIDLSYDLEGRVQTQTATEYNRKGKPLAEPVMSMFSYETSGEQQSESGPQTPYPTIETFNYDDLGNRQSYVRDIETGYTHSETYTTNDFNQYTQITTDPVLGSIVTASLQYDLAGNLIVDKQGYQYFYDEENRLIGVDDINNNSVVDYEYDAFGRRIRMEDAATNKTTHYYYDMDWRVSSEYEMVTAGSEPPKLARSFIYGNGIDEVLGMFCPGTPESGSTSDLTTLGQFAVTWLKTSTDSGYNGTFDTDADNKITLPDYTSLRNGWTYKPAGPEQRWYYMKDGLGSVMGVVGSHSGAESEFYLYDVYGKSNEQSQIGNPYRFTGRRLDVLDNGQFELQYLRFRYYNSDMGKFLTKDPIGYKDGLNLYNYVKNNPVNFIDPVGLALYAFDGTNNNKYDDTLVQTNVAILYETYLKKNNSKYYKGVGTYEDRYFDSTLGSGTGAGGRAILDKAYKDLIRNFRKGDKDIDIIGFSRGAALAREFSNMIYNRKNPLDWAYESDGVKNACVGIPPKIRFLGLFDTVSSFGIPGNKTNYGKVLNLPPNVIIARHAVAMHERRSGFPLDSIMPSYGYLDPTSRLIEKPFIGAHADIGGGYKDNYLTKRPLVWMRDEGVKAGVPFGELDLSHIQQQRIGLGIHQSNAWFWLFRDHPIFDNYEDLVEAMKDNRVIHYRKPIE